MARTFDVIVVGKGMMGAAAARHLAQAGVRVALVGPDEPKHRQTYRGAFASHHDAGRITRTIDEDPDWALMARRSIERYRNIEAQSGIQFYSEVGCLIAAPANDPERYLERAVEARDQVNSEADLLDAASLKAAFPEVHFPTGYSGLYERRRAGHIDPRALVRAQTHLAAAFDAAVMTTEVVALHDRRTHVEASTLGGKKLLAESAVVAAGGYSIRRGLLPRPLDLTVKARTVLLVEVDDEERERYVGMPSLIQVADDDANSFYVLPPIRYPDGRHYLKIGGDPVDIVLGSEREINAWFRGDGNHTAAARMRLNLGKLLPDLKGGTQSTIPCITTYTRHGHPYIGFADSDRIVVLTGGNGQAAKSSDEIGRLGAVMATTGTLDGEGYATKFELA